jgi:hypothetical protein
VRDLIRSVALAAAVLIAACGEEPFQPGQTGEVRGTAFDASTGGLLGGVTVMVGGKSAQSGSNGQYVLEGVPTGEHSLTASKEEYLPQNKTVMVVAGDTTFINVSLAPDRAPSGLTAETGSASGQIHLRWGVRANVDSYALYWSTEPGAASASGTRIPDIQGTSYDHSGLSPDATYYYVLAAVTNGVEGPLSPEVSATAGNGITLTVQDPGGGFVADTNFQATVLISSVFEVVSVTATVEARVTPLAFLRLPDRWHARVSLAGLPSPQSRTVTFTATDINGTVATASQSFEHNRKAIITIESPRPGAVALPNVRLRARCEDDVAVGCAAFEATIVGFGEHIQGGPTQLDRDISLAMFDGHTVPISFQATDDLGRFTNEVVVVYVDASSRLTKVDEVAGLGTIIDASTDRLLVQDTVTNADSHIGTLKIQPRAAGQTTDILTRRFLEVFNAHLTAHGAVLEARDDATNFVHGFEWRDNVLLDLGVTDGFTVDQPYFAWEVFRGAIQRQNLESGATIVVPAGEEDGLADVGPNGDVLYVTPFSEIKRFRDGTTTTIVPLDPDPNVRNGGALTDGVNVCYSTRTRPDVGAAQRFHNLLALTSGGIDTLVVYQVPLDDDEPRFEPICLLNGGWIAFTKPATGGTVQVWVRDPAGTHTQISFFSGVSVIEELAADGRVVFSNPAGQPVRRRYLWTPGGTPTDISSGLGRPKFIDGQLHVMLGDALLRVN